MPYVAAEGMKAHWLNKCIYLAKLLDKQTILRIKKIYNKNNILFHN